MNEYFWISTKWNLMMTRKYQKLTGFIASMLSQGNSKAVIARAAICCIKNEDIDLCYHDDYMGNDMVGGYNDN